MHHLQLVFHVTQKNVSPGECVVLHAGKQGVFRKRIERPHGVAFTHISQPSAVGGFERLHNQFDLSNTAWPKFHVSADVPAAGYFFVYLSLHLEDIVDGLESEGSRVDERFSHFKKAATQSTIPCDRPRLNQSQSFPRCEPLFVVASVHAERISDISCLPFRPESKINAINIAFARKAAETPGDLLRKPAEVLRGGEAPGFFHV